MYNLHTDLAVGTGKAGITGTSIIGDEIVAAAVVATWKRQTLRLDLIGEQEGDGKEKPLNETRKKEEKEE